MSERPWHINLNGYARAYHKPPNWRGAAVMWLRGWRKDCFDWWTKPNGKEREQRNE